MRKHHQNWTAPVQVRVLELPADGDAQTAATISLMREFARADAASPPVRALAAQAPAPLRAAAEHIFWTVRRAVRFQRDTDLAQGVEGWSPDIVEVLIRPVDLLAMRPPDGDCDDFSMLVAALLTARGIPSSFATVAADPLEPTRYSHVYVVAHLPNGDFALDASHGSLPGWECPNEFGKRRLWPVGEGGMNGLGQSPVPVYSTTVTGQIPTDVPWWQQLVNRGLDIVQSRFSLPENTFVVTKAGVTSRGSAQSPAAVPTTDARASLDVSGVSGNTLIFGAVALLLLLAVVMMSRGGGGRR